MLAGRTADIYCADMAGTPKEYVTLQKTGPTVNYSFFEGDHVDHRYRSYLIPGTDAHTGYRKVRIDPTTLVVDQTDRRFADRISVGRNGYDWSNPSFNPVPEVMNFGTAGDCYNMWSARGRANVDLTGTDFAIDDSVVFAVGGWAANGSATIDATRKVVQMTGGGWCGGAGPVGALKLVPSTELLPTDDTPPTITPRVTMGTEGLDGWYTSDVTLSWEVADDGSAIASAPCVGGEVTTDTQGQTFTCSATSAGGTAEGRVVIKRDATVPVITYTGGGSYMVDQTVEIACTVSDATSGTDGVCEGTTVKAYNLSADQTYTLSASASDRAGNEASNEVSYTVTATEASLANVVRVVVADADVATGLSDKLAAMAKANNANAKAGAKRAFQNQLRAQTGKSVEATDAAMLLRWLDTL